MVKVNSKVGGLSTRSTVRCGERVVLYSTQSLESQFSLFLLPGAIPPFFRQPRDGPAHWPMGPIGGLGQIEKPIWYRSLRSLALATVGLCACDF